MMTKILEAAQYIQTQCKTKPRIGIVLGSGLGIYIDQIQNKTIIPYQDIPHFKRTSVEGHQGCLILGEVHGVPVAALQGRLHAYEGHPMEEIVLPIRVLATLGIEILFHFVLDSSCQKYKERIFVCTYFGCGTYPVH